MMDSVVRIGDRLKVFGLSESVWLSRQSSEATRVSSEHLAVILTVVGAAGQPNGAVLKGGEPFRLVADDQTYLERARLMYMDDHWRTGRFAPGFVSEPTQSLTVPSGSGAALGEPLRYGRVIGVDFGGAASDRSSAACSDRRFLTLRGCDQPTVVVNAYNVNEQLRFVLVESPYANAAPLPYATAPMASPLPYATAPMTSPLPYATAPVTTPYAPPPVSSSSPPPLPVPSSGYSSPMPVDQKAPNSDNKAPTVFFGATRPWTTNRKYYSPCDGFVVVRAQVVAVGHWHINGVVDGMPRCSQALAMRRHAELQPDNCSFTMPVRGGETVEIQTYSERPSESPLAVTITFWPLSLSMGA